MLMSSPERSIVKVYQNQILGFGIWIVLFITLWEAAIHSSEWTWKAVPILLLSFYLVEKAISLRLASKKLPCDRLLFLITFILLGSFPSIIVAAISLTASTIKSYSRSRSMALEMLLRHLPVIIGMWFTTKLYAIAYSTGTLAFLGMFFPLIFVAVVYYFLYTLLAAVSFSLCGSVRMITEWKERYSDCTIVVFAAAFTLGLIDYFATHLGSSIYVLTVPFALVILSTHKIHRVKLEKSAQRLTELSGLQMSIIETLALAIDAKDHSTHGHARRVQVYATGIARSLGFTGQEDIEALSTAALLHDIGKLAIPEYILSKPGKLSDSEFSKMKQHAEIGANILEPIRFNYPVVPIIRYHHERYNGSGYPRGLKGDQIPLGARILAVADTFDALTAQRTYRSPMSVGEAVELIEREAGTCFDPEIVRAFVGVAAAIWEEVSTLDFNKYSSHTHLASSAPESEQEQKLRLRKKGFTEIASTHREIYALHEIFQTVGKSLSVDDTLRIICSKLQSVIPFSTAVVYLKNKKTELIYPAMIAGEYAEELNGNCVHLGEGLTGYCIAFNQQVVNSDPALDFQNLTYLQRPHNLTNAMIFPLKAKDSVLGAIALYSGGDEGLFTHDHVRFMEVVSEKAAISIQNAMSFEYYEENSLTDQLTGLPNSRYMFMAFEQNIKKAERTKEKMAILVMDLNNFKEINDQYGHRVGDEVLIKVGEILQKEMRKYDTCIRYAGDEFVAFLYDAEQATAERIADRIRRAVRALVLKVRSGKEVHLGISIGLSMYPQDGTELTQLFTVADSQMYNEKFEGKNQTVRELSPIPQDAVETDADIRFQRAN